VEASVVAPESSGSVEVEADGVKESVDIKVKGNYIIAKFTGTGSIVTFIDSNPI
jgi:hypothetical protein